MSEQSNIKYIKQWYLFYHQTDVISQQLVGQLPWKHNIVFISKCKDCNDVLYYVCRPCAEGRGSHGAGSGVKLYFVDEF